MSTLKERCEEAIRSEVLKELKGKLVSQCGFYSCIVNEESGTYGVEDVEVSIREESMYDDEGHWAGDHTRLDVTVVCEHVKTKKNTKPKRKNTRRFTYDLFV